jgi:molybdate transport repressor ModE-like protein
MARPRLIHGLSTPMDEVPAATKTPTPSPDPALLGAPASPPRLTAVGLGGSLRQVQMENIHPLRLRILLEIDRTGSISAAAETCGIGQPSASMHLRTLETAIGQRLVTRTRRGSRLTAAGKIVVSHAARVLAILDRMQQALHTLDAGGQGELTVAASLTPSVALLPRILRQFSDRYPGVSVRLRTVASETVVREVARSAAAIGIASEVATEEPVVRRQILMDELVGIAPFGLFNSTGGFVSQGELARHSLLLGGDGSSTRIVTERYLARAEYQPARICAFDSYEAIKRAVADGFGVSFISELLVRGEIDRGELEVFRIFGVGRLIRPIYVVQSSATELTPEGAAFLSLLLDANLVRDAQEQPGVSGAHIS